jgi:hypothetical protein
MSMLEKVIRWGIFGAALAAPLVSACSDWAGDCNHNANCTPPDAGQEGGGGSDHAGDGGYDAAGDTH